MHKRLTLMTVALSGVCDVNGGELSRSNAFTDHMVLQRGKAVRIYGTGQEGGKVSVDFGKQHVETTVKKNGQWQLELSRMAASADAKTLTVSSDSKLKKLSDVLVGDVWVCSGQSNMGWGIFQSYPIPSTFPHSAKLRLIKSACPVGKSTPQGEYTIDDHFKNSW